jgi:hypothetical protein
MGYASQVGRARTNASNPTASGICDRCGFRYTFSDLQWQFDWRGAALQNLRILVCRDCLDRPQEQLRAIVIPADPTPIVNARVQDFTLASVDNFAVSAPTTYDPTTGLPLPPQNVLITQDGQNLTTQPIGIPADLDPNAVPPLNGKLHFNVTIPVLTVYSTGGNTITVNCSSPHGLQAGYQFSIEGLTSKEASGFYNVTAAPTATVFTYTTNRTVPSGTISTSTTRAATADVGLPYGYTQIPQTGI